MFVKRAREITREVAIERITEIAALIKDRGYRGIVEAGEEVDYDVSKFVEGHSCMG